MAVADAYMTHNAKSIISMNRDVLKSKMAVAYKNELAHHHLYLCMMDLLLFEKHRQRHIQTCHK